MSAFADALDAFLAAVRGDDAWVEELNEHSRQFGSALSAATPDEIATAQRAFAGLFPNVRPVATGHVGISCGSLVECGGDPHVTGFVLLDLLPHLLKNVGDFYELAYDRAANDAALASEIEKRKADDPDYDLDAYIADESWDALGMRFGPALFETHPMAVFAHMADRFYALGVIAHLSRSKELRAAARARPELLERSRANDGAYGGGASHLTCMLRVLDDEPLLVLHPAEGKGYALRVSGVADNFQLHTLLAGELIGDGRLSGEPPSERVLALARGIGEQSERLHASGSFNLWNWTGLRADGTLPEGQAGSEHWIWNEGVPADVRAFEGTRVVLLGPPPYSRGWNAGRRFAHMPVECDVERELSASEVRDVLARIASAPRP
jgi:hypothetical protein